MTKYKVMFELETGLVAAAVRDMVAVQFDTAEVDVTEVDEVTEIEE